MSAGPQLDASMLAAQRFAFHFPEALRPVIPRRDWYTWGRYAVVIGLHEHGPEAWIRYTLFVAVPPCGPIIAAALARRDELRSIMADSRVTFLLTAYPDEYTRERALREHGREFAPTPEWPPRKNVSPRRYKSATSTIRQLRARVRELEAQA